MMNMIDNKKLFISFASLFFICLVFSLLLIQKSYSEVFSNNIHKTCNFNYNNQSNIRLCYEHHISKPAECISHPAPSNLSTIKTPLSPTVNFHYSNFTTIWKSKVQPLLMPHEKYNNVGEPSIASNGTYVFYTGNHYAAKSKIGGNWTYVDPSFDFKGLLPSNANAISSGSSSNTAIDLFKADQRTIYDSSHHMYMWIRLGEPFLNGHVTNIERLAISNDTVNWIAYDFKPIDIFKTPDIIHASLDYPEAIISKNYLYLTSSLVVGDNCQKEYGIIIRISLNDLSNSLKNLHSTFPYYAILDRNVTAIAPVDGVSNTSAYFGALLNNSLMRVYEWKEGSIAITNKTVPIAPWNNIHNSESCGSDLSKSDKWWCNANTSSRIRSAWLYNDSLNFLWNAVTTYDNGSTWKPYMDVATFNIIKNMSYDRKYYIADNYVPWIFGAAVPNERGDLGIISYYVTNNSSDPDTNPYLNLAFGLFNHSTNKWNMMSLINSSASLPVKDENIKDNYNFGDFITIRKHPTPIDGYSWDAAGYVIVGKNYYEIEPYFIMIK